MRGSDDQTSLFSYVSCEARVPSSHSLRRICAVVDEALDVLSPEFDRMYAQGGRASIAPEKLLRALLLQALYSIRSERQLMEQLGYNLLFPWFVGPSMDAPVWDASTFSKNRDRLLEGCVAQRLLGAIIAQPRVRALMSDEHFSVDGTLIQAWASHKSFQPKSPPVPGEDPDPPPPDASAAAPAGPPSPPARPGRNQARDWRGQKRSNETHASLTDPDARARIGQQGTLTRAWAEVARVPRHRATSATSGHPCSAPSAQAAGSPPASCWRAPTPRR